MNTKILEYIISIAQEKSISKAAECHFLSRSALFRHLQRIEKEIGVPLFEHRKEGLVPTPAGIIYINNAQAILHVEEQLNHTIELMKYNEKKKISILIDSPYINFFQAEILPLFIENYPDYTFNFSAAETTQMKTQLLNHQADLAIFPSAHTEDITLNYIPLFKEQLEIVFSCKNKITQLNIDEQIEFLKQKNLQYILLNPNCSFRYLQNDFIASLGLIPHIIFEVKTFHEALNCLSKNDCCTILPKGFISSVKHFNTELQQVVQPYPFYAILAYSKNSYFGSYEYKMLMNIVEHFPDFHKYLSKKGI